MRSITIIFATLFLLSLNTSVSAGYSEEELKLEISFLAKKLLKVSGESEITVSQPASDKPFLGICIKIIESGVLLTCITPGQNAEAAGLKTGDIVTAIGDSSLVGIDEKKGKDSYHNIVNNWKIGDTYTFKIIRNGKNLDVEATVGAIKHPAYTITVSEE